MEHDFATTLDVLGIEIDVFVTYKITSYGSAASWEEPGDPVEIYILSVKDKYNNDMLLWCNINTYYNDPKHEPGFYLTYTKRDQPFDRVRNAMFGLGHVYVKIRRSGKTYLEHIEELILGSDGLDDNIYNDSSHGY